MNFRELKESLDDMTDEQLAMEARVMVNDETYPIELAFGLNTKKIIFIPLILDVDDG